MSVKTAPKEIRELLSWLGNPPRTKKQVNRVNEADAEILRIAPNRWMAFNVDGIAEEIEFGLYRDPYTMGWVCVQATLSDIAACGAKPTGFMSSAVFSRGFDLAAKRRFQKGMNDALRSLKTPLLGGDFGESAQSVFHGFAIGESSRRPLTRVGIRAGDWIGAVGSFGVGPALGFRFLTQSPESYFPESNFRPVAKLSEGARLIRVANAAIDTSDGLASALHTLSVLNDLRFEIDFDQIPYDKKAVEFCSKINIPRETLLFGEHGDYQLIFTAAPDDFVKIQRQVRNITCIGKVLKRTQKHHLFHTEDRTNTWDPGHVVELNKDSIEKMKSAFTDVVEWARRI